jgi:ABC-type antimicrobial peptide transport system permease subunit
LHLLAIRILEAQIVGVFAGIVAIPIAAWIYPKISSALGATNGVHTVAFPCVAPLSGLVVGVIVALLGNLGPAFHASRVRISNVMRE